MDTAGDAGAAVGGGRLHNDDNFTCLQHKNCCQVAEDKDEKKKEHYLCLEETSYLNSKTGRYTMKYYTRQSSLRNSY